MTISRSLPWLIAAAAFAGGLGLYFGQRHFAPAPETVSTPATSGVQSRTALVYPQPRALDPFSLERTDGTPLTLADLEGRWTLLFIGFTHCPDACPQALSMFRDLEKTWPDDAGPAPTLVFVSVDPERDTPDLLADYTHYFSPRIVAATATHDRLLAFTRQLGMVYMTSPQDGGGYTVDHSTHFALIDPDARMVAMFRPPLDPVAITADLLSIAAAREAVK